MLKWTSLVKSFGLLLLLAAAPAALAAEHIRSVTSLTEVTGAGQRVTAALLEFDTPIATAALTPTAFTVDGRSIARIYANAVPALAAQGVDGPYVILELAPAGADGSSRQKGGGFSRVNVQLAVRQVEPVATVDGGRYQAFIGGLRSDRVTNRVVDDFQQMRFQDPATGLTIKYNLFVPKNYDATRSYPLVLFIHDAGVLGAAADTTLLQGLGAVIWASPEEQARHECLVLAPQFERATVNDRSEATLDLEATVNLISNLSARYRIDPRRIYATGQSMGCMSSIAIMIQHPDLFAAALLVAGQWDPAKVAPLARQNLWIIVSEGDPKAFPGMNAITATLEQAGAKVSRATWSGQSSPAEFTAAAQAMLAQGNRINYTVLRKGTVVPAGMADDGGSNHVCTWRIAYTIEAVRDWLFRQSR